MIRSGAIKSSETRENQTKYINPNPTETVFLYPAYLEGFFCTPAYAHEILQNYVALITKQTVMFEFCLIYIILHEVHALL